MSTRDLDAQPSSSDEKEPLCGTVTRGTRPFWTPSRGFMISLFIVTLILVLCALIHKYTNVCVC